MYIPVSLFWKALSETEKLGWSLHTLLASVGIDNRLIVHWEPLVGVYSGTEQSRVGLKEIRERWSLIWSVISLSNIWLHLLGKILRRSSMLHNALQGYTTQRLHWDGSSRPCPQFCRTWEDSWVWHHPPWLSSPKIWKHTLFSFLNSAAFASFTFLLLIPTD